MVMKNIKREISLPHLYKSKHPVQIKQLPKAAYKIITDYSQSAKYQSGTAKNGEATFARLLWIAKQLVCACNAMGNVL